MDSPPPSDPDSRRARPATPGPPVWPPNPHTTPPPGAGAPPPIPPTFSPPAFTPPPPAPTPVIVREQPLPQRLSITIAVLAALFIAGIACALSGALLWKESQHQDLTVRVVPASRAPVKQTDSPLQAVYARVLPGVVTVRAEIPEQDSEAIGTGFVIDPQGWILTSLHVVAVEEKDGARWKLSSKVWVDYANGSGAEAKLYGWDASSDLALLRTDGTPAGTPALTIGDSTMLRVGDPVFAIGAPFGEQGSLATGVVSGTDRSITSPQDGFSIENVLQTDVAINHGNSGGPLLNLKGEVVGVNEQIQTTTDVSSGVSFSVPSALVQNRLPRLREGGAVKVGYLGASTFAVTPQMRTAFDEPDDCGALIATVGNGSPAQVAGLRGATRNVNWFGVTLAVGGDCIVTIDGEPITSSGDVSEAITAHAPGELVTMRVVNPGGFYRDVQIPLGQRPDNG